MSEVKKFSLKKLLLTILITTSITSCIGFTFLFISAIPSWVIVEVMDNAEPEVLREIGTTYQEVLENMNERDIQEYGEDFPSEGLFAYTMMNYSRSKNVISTYLVTLSIGIVLGVMIYIIAIQEAKGKKLILEIVGLFIILVAIIMLANVGYETLINKAIIDINEREGIKYETYLYDIQNNDIFTPYLVCFVIIYLGNLIRQKVISNKLNKELNNKE